MIGTDMRIAVVVLIGMTWIAAHSLWERYTAVVVLRNWWTEQECATQVGHTKPEQALSSVGGK